MIGHYISYIDDDEDDVWVFKESFSNLTNLPIMIFRDGKSFYNHLIENLQNLPCLSVMDINMPGFTGLETLKLIKQNQALNILPVVMFSTSASAQDTEFCRQYNVDIVTKPVIFSQWTEAAKKLLTYCEIV